jgi:Ribbon-helix-helix protein, copG family
MVFAEPIGDTGGFLVTLECGHKKATREKAVSYDCMACASDERFDGVHLTRSGTPTTPNAGRKRPMVTLTLSPEAIARLDAIADHRGQTRSGAVEQLIRNARLAEK